MEKLKRREINDGQSYGKVIIKIKPIVDKRGLTIYGLSILAGLKHQTVKSYYTNTPLTRVDMDVLARLCYVLNCKISDVLEYIPNK